VRSAERRPTLADVATRAGVSTSLVSLVMRDEPGASAETRRRILDAADELGYYPDSRARLLRSGRSRLLGVVFGIQHAFHADLVTDLYTAAGETGYELALSAVTPDRDETDATAGLLQDRCEALILLAPHASAASLARLATRLPVVVLARGVRGAAVDVIRTADAEGLRQAVDHLVLLGHHRIVHVDGGRAPGAAPSTGTYGSSREAPPRRTARPRPGRSSTTRRRPSPSSTTAVPPASSTSSVATD
jgi:DNA-binding LacI/PurR family transcriptional regulator